MSIDTGDLADRIRAILAHRDGISEIRMMGGLCFMLNGNMVVGTMKNGDLLARVGADNHADALKRPGADPMQFTNRPMKGFVNVSDEVLDDATLNDWVSTSLAFVGSMPAKKTNA